MLVFERSGAVSTSFVRAGEGPGEHDYPLHLQVLPGDTIVLWGLGFGRISHYDPAGNLLQERRIDARPVIDAMRTSDEAPGESVYLPLPDGSFLLRLSRPNWRRPTTAGTIFRHPRGYVRIDSAYSVHSFGWWGGEEVLATVGWDWHILPFPTNSMAVGADTPPRWSTSPMRTGTKFISFRPTAFCGESSGASSIQSPSPTERSRTTLIASCRSTAGIVPPGIEWCPSFQDGITRPSTTFWWTRKAICGHRTPGTSSVN